MSNSFGHHVLPPSTFSWRPLSLRATTEVTDVPQSCKHVRSSPAHQASQFDMRRAGGLTDPDSKLPMKSGMTVLTSFAHLYNRIHGLVCDHRHGLQPLEGSRHHQQGIRMLRSQFAEVCLRTFARMVAHVLTKDTTCHSYSWSAAVTSHSVVTRCQQQSAEAWECSLRLRQTTTTYCVVLLCDVHAQLDGCFSKGFGL